MQTKGHKFAKDDVKQSAQLIVQEGAIDLTEYFLKGSVRLSGKRQIIRKA